MQVYSQLLTEDMGTPLINIYFGSVRYLSFFFGEKKTVNNKKK